MNAVYARDPVLPMGYVQMAHLYSFSLTHLVSRLFYFFYSVQIDGADLDPDDWVGAFNGDICVGARKWDTSQCGDSGNL